MVGNLIKIVNLTNKNSEFNRVFPVFTAVCPPVLYGSLCLGDVPATSTYQLLS